MSRGLLGEHAGLCGLLKGRVSVYVLTCPPLFDALIKGKRRFLSTNPRGLSTAFQGSRQNDKPPANTGGKYDNIPHPRPIPITPDGRQSLPWQWHMAQLRGN